MQTAAYADKKKRRRANKPGAAIRSPAFKLVPQIPLEANLQAYAEETTDVVVDKIVTRRDCRR